MRSDPASLPVLTQSPGAASRPFGPGAWGASSILVVLVVVILLSTRAGQLLNDPDSQWHMAIGRWIVAHGTVPWTDLFSHTFAGSPWIAKEWASQVLFYGAYALAGWWGVCMLTILVVAGSLAGLHLWLQCRVSTLAALTTVTAVFVVLAPHLLARPHILTVPILLVWMTGLVAALERGRAPSFWLIPVMVAWANLHGSYPIGLVIAALLAGEGVFSGPHSEWIGRASRWARFLTLATVASCLTPYGYAPFLVNLGLFNSGESLPFIQEWQPLGLDGAGVVAVAMFISSIAVLLTAPRKTLFRLGVVTLLGVMMVRHARFADLFVLAAPILVAGPALARFPKLRAGPAVAAPRRLGLVILACGILAIATATLVTPRLSAAMTPQAALDAARARGLTGPVYNDYDFGGFLIRSGVPTFIDGRSDQLFLGGFMNGLDRALAASEPDRFAALLAHYRVTWAIVRREGRSADRLRRLEGWRLLHEDETAAVYHEAGDAPAAR
ncbi:hypothetical protein MBUL_01150 [Methylobacterium bullatum]|uniref:Glycosyltransferase RgtA/B/C/D-like domain-containing protein n=1 Tax=Methylobacterium bullatum TaxID=570505 RepID=A0A679IYP2_9HYPH|nr:hypothetical protein MBUL_01150 [Methylobacterium bullatum]